MSLQYPLPLPHREAMGADDFLVADSNREAVAWIDRWPEWPRPCVILYGPTGSGKTHLAQVWRTRSKAERGQTDPTAGRALAGTQPIVIDDADTVAGEARLEEALFHLYNRINESKGYLLLTATLPPAQWRIGLPDLRSRLLAAPAAALTLPDDALLAALLVKQFHDRQITVGDELVDYLLPRIERTPVAISRRVAALDRAALAEGRRITIALARKVLEDSPLPRAGGG